MDFVVGLSVPDPQHAHIVAESCRELAKISKIPGSEIPSAKNDE